MNLIIDLLANKMLIGWILIGMLLLSIYVIWIHNLLLKIVSYLPFGLGGLAEALRKKRADNIAELADNESRVQLNMIRMMWARSRAAFFIVLSIVLFIINASTLFLDTTLAIVMNLGQLYLGATLLYDNTLAILLKRQIDAAMELRLGKS